MVALVYLVLVLVRPVAERVIVLCSARAGERFLGDLRTAAYDKLQELSMPFFEETRAGVLVSRLTADVQTLTTFTRQVLVEVVGSVLLFGVTVVILVSLSPLLSLVMLISVPLLAWSSLRYGKRSRPAFLALRDRVADTMTSLQEGLAGVRVVQSFAQEQEQYAAYRAQSRAQVSAWRRISLVNIGFFPMIAFAQALALAAVLVVGGYLERHGRVTVGTIVAFALYLISLFDPVARLGDWYSEFQSGRAALAKISSLLAEPATVLGGTGSLPDGGELRADADHVRVRRQRARGLRSFTRRRAGRAPRPRRCHGGGQIDAREAPRPRVRPAGGVGLARRGRPARGDPRRVALPHRLRPAGGTPVLRLDRRQRAARAPGGERRRGARGAAGDRRARRGSRRSPTGSRPDVRSRGVRLSAGERQLVSIARVALVDPAVIVLDEATSSLDPQTEAAVEHALSVLTPRAHGDHDRAPALDGGARRPRRRDGARAARRDRLTRRARRTGRPLRRLWASWQAGLAV